MDRSRRDAMRQSFIQAVKQMDPMDALVVKAVREAGGTSWVNRSGIAGGHIV
jgi:hypothetical protein